jgi:hypothetical protein
MTTRSPAYLGAEHTSRLGESAQRVLMALMVLVLLQQLVLPTPLLGQLTGYANPGGMPLLKIHFYSYTLFIALAFVFACIGPVRFASEQIAARPGVVQFACVVVLCAMITVARQGVGGVAYMVDTLLAAPLAVMLAFYLDEERRRKLTALIIYFVTFNAIIGVAERLTGFKLFHFPDLEEVSFFRSTALMGHPLENAFVTSSVMFLVLAVPWSAWRKAFILAICMAGILSFGARSSFALTILLGVGASLFFLVRGLLRGDMRLSTLAGGPWIAGLALAGGAALTFGTVLGTRIVELAKFDGNAQVRVDAFKVLNYLSPNELLYGADSAEIKFLIETFKDVDIVENCWVGMLLLLGVILFAVLVVSLLGFLRSISRGRGALAAFAVLNFLLVASTSNSISTKTASLALFSVAMVGIPYAVRRREEVEAVQPVHYEVALREGVWS